MNLENEVSSLEKKWADWDIACQSHVADELAANEMQRVRAENSRGGIPLATEDALEQYEDTWRKDYDITQSVAGTVLQAETKVLGDQLDEAIAMGATLRSERQQHGTSTSNGLMAGVLEELTLQRLMREACGLTLTDLSGAYASWTDDADRTAVRLVEAAVTAKDVTRLGLRPDPERDATAILELHKRVAQRRRARVAPALYVLRDRLAGVRTATRQQLFEHFKSGRGIAKRPRLMTVNPR